ncbi:MAG: c-type cytochrome [Oceanicoccus sp.]
MCFSSYPRIWSILFALLAIPAWAQDSLSEGRAIYESCIVCHGAKGEGNNAVNAPALAGQSSGYIARQLSHFKSGIRGAEPGDIFGKQMRLMTAVLADDQAIAIVADYIASLPVSVVEIIAEGDLRNGNNIYQGNCGSCHGGRGQGNAALHSPRLAGLNREYIIRQYRNFQQGLRGSHPDDRFGKQMKMMAASLSTENDLHDVIAYIHAQTQQ